MSVSQKIREVRGYMTRRKFAELTGINQQTIYDYEKGRRIPSIEQLKRIAEKTSTSESWLINDETSALKISTKNPIVVQRNNQGNIIGVASGDILLEGEKKKNEDVVACQRCIELENIVNEKNEEISKLQTELLEMQKKYMKLLEKMAGV